MDLGVHVQLGPKTPDSAKQIEGYGFDYITCGERLMAGVETTNALVTLAAAASVTASARLLTGILQLPMYSPALVAKMATTVSWISGGRLDLGVGVGGEDPTEFKAAGVPVTERGRRADEALEMLSQLWQGGPRNHAGEFSQLESFELRPSPLERPPIWVSGRSKAAIRRTASHGDGWLPYLMMPEQLADAKSQLNEAATQAGRRPDDIRTGLACMVSIDEDAEAARVVGLDHVATAWGRDFSINNREEYLIMGTPGRVADRLLEYRAAGVSLITMTLMGGQQDQQLELLGREVLPRIRSAGQ